MQKLKRVTEEKGVQFRHELKYYMAEGQALLLENRLAMSMDRDPHAGKSGAYHIRSLYFDDVYDTAFKTKLDGEESRKKYRIRIYNLRDDVIKLECKQKEGSYVRKTSCSISRPVADSMIQGRPEGIMRVDHPLAREVYIKMRLAGLKPAVIVDYMRVPFVSQYQSVRITLDQDLSTGLSASDMFNRSLATVPALENGETVLEVKFNEFLPDYYRDLLAGTNAQRGAVSKYCICRKFE